MGEFLFFACALIVGLIVVVWVSSSSAARIAEEERFQRFAALAAEKERLDLFLVKEALGWAFQDKTNIDRDAGFVAISEDGKTVRLATYKDEAGALQIVNDERMSIGDIKSIDVSQPMKAKTQVHVEKVPVSVQTSKKSPVGRAMVGGIVAGPLGAIVGAASGVGSKSEVQYHETRRSETVMVKDHAVLILGTGNFKRPTIRLAFGDNKVLNQWSARLWAARGW